MIIKFSKSVKQAVGTNTTKFTYDGMDVVMDDDSVSGITKYQNGQGIDNKLKMVTGGNVKYFLADHLGSTNGLTDASGNLTATTSYNSFGNPTNANFPTRYQYTGREFDSSTGLYYYRARWYDSQLGRFISEDPIGLKGGINQFSYINNNSLNFTDPLGLFPSMGIWQYHQSMTFRVAREQELTPRQARMMADEQYDFDSSTQDEAYSPWHAMRRRDQSPEDARQNANRFVRNQICLAKKLKAMGFENQSLIALSRAMHTLQDSSSPAHYDFQPAWEDTYKNRGKELLGGHYWKENFMPGEQSIAYEQTRKAWGYYNGNKMPDDFFIDDYYDSSSGRVYSPSKTRRSPDGGNCDCK